MKRTKAQSPINKGFLFLCVAGLMPLILSACEQDANPSLNTVTPAPTREITQTVPKPTTTSSPSTDALPTDSILEESVDPDDLQGLTVQLWHSFSGSRENVILKFVNEFNAQNEYGITAVTHTKVDLFRDVRDAIFQDDPPDVVIAFTNQTLAWEAEGGQILDLQSYIQDTVYGYSEEVRGDFFPAFLEKERVGEKLYGVPVYRSSQVIFYNTSWANALGFSAPPRTSREFKEQACSAAQANLNDEDPDNDGTGGWFINTSTGSILSWMYAFGGEITTQQGDYQFNTQATTEAFAFLKDLAQNGCAWRTDALFPNEEFAKREGLFYTSSIAGLPFQEAAFDEIESSDEWIMIPFPTPEGGSITHIFGPAYTLFKTTPERQLAAWFFVKWMNSAENQATWVENTGYFPTRATTLNLLDDYLQEHPQWRVLPTILPEGKPEPAFSSWGIVRWAISDAAEELFEPTFPKEEIPSLMEQLESTAAEIHAQYR